MRGAIAKRGSTWTVRYDEHGKRRQRSKGGFKTRREAESFLSESLSQLGDGSYATPAKTTLAEYLLGEWLPTVDATLRPLSRTKYRSQVRLYIVPNLGHLRLQSVSGAHLNGLARAHGQRPSCGAFWITSLTIVSSRSGGWRRQRRCAVASSPG